MMVCYKGLAKNKEANLLSSVLNDISCLNALGLLFKDASLPQNLLLDRIVFTVVSPCCCVHGSLQEVASSDRQ